MSKSARYFVPARYTELGTYLCLEIITLFVNPPTAVSFGVLKAYKKSQGFVLKIGDFFLVWVRVMVYNDMRYHVSRSTGTYGYSNKRPGLGFSLK